MNSFCEVTSAMECTNAYCNNAQVVCRTQREINYVLDSNTATFDRVLPPLLKFFDSENLLIFVLAAFGCAYIGWLGSFKWFGMSGSDSGLIIRGTPLMLQLIIIFS